MCSSSPAITPKLQLADEQPSMGECWIPPKKDTPCPRAKESHIKVVGGAKSCLNLKPAGDTQKDQTKPCVH